MEQYKLPDNISESAHQAAIVRMVYEARGELSAGRLSFDEYTVTMMCLASHIFRLGAHTPGNVKMDELKEACQYLGKACIDIAKELPDA